MLLAAQMGGLFYWRNEMRFKSYIGKQVMFAGRVFEFAAEIYETEDEKEIEALSGAADVIKLKQKKSKTDDSASDDSADEDEAQDEDQKDDSAA
jgi:hypothetical protein